MAISNAVTRVLLIILLTGVMASCYSEKCLFVKNEFTIDNWNGSAPKHGVLYRYKKGSNFSVLEQKNEDDFYAEISSPDLGYPPYLIVRFTGYKKLPTNADYKLVLDNKIQYRFYGLKPGYVEQACLFSGGKVNQCDINNGMLSATSSCGEPVK